MIEEKTLKYLSFLAPYSVSVCLLYLFGFWSTFGINILEFISFSDVAKLGVYPIFVGFVAAFIAWNLTLLVQRLRLHDMEEGQRVTRNKGIRRRMFYAAMPILLVWAALVVRLYIRSHPQFWQMLALLVGFILVSFIPVIERLKPIIPNLIVRVVVIGVVVILPPLSFGIGKSDAHMIKAGKRIKVVSTQIFKEQGSDVFKNKRLLEGQEQLKFVGAAGDYLFFLTMDNATIIAAKYSDLHFLELKALN